jgi:hypothetical protein
MSTEATTSATSQAESAPTAQPKSDEKSGNLTAGQMAQRLLQRGASLASSTPSADQATAPANTPVDTAQTTPAPVADEATPESPDPEAETPDETAEVLSQSHALPPEVQAKVDKRIGKEVARRKAAEEEVTRLRAQVSQPAQPQDQAAHATPTPANPLAHVQDVGQLAKEQSNIKEIKRWAQAQLARDDVDVGVEGYGKTWSRSDLHQTIIAAERVLEDQIPQRYQFLTGRAHSERAAAEQFPWMKDKSSNEFAEYQTAFRQYPWLNDLPEAPMIVAVQMAGAKYLREQAEAKQKAAAAAAKKPVTAAPPASQTAIGGAPGAIRETQGAAAKKQDDAATNALKNKGNVTQKDMARLLSQRDLSSR